MKHHMHPHHTPEEGRRRHRHHGGWGPGGPGRGPGFGRRKRMRRGDVRAALLVLLDEEPRNGYGLMQEIEERSGGAWRPSPGSVYPSLAQLEDEGLVRPDDEGTGKRFALTDEGRAHVEEHREQLGEPWAQLEGEGGGLNLRKEFGPLAVAAQQVAQAGSAEQIEQAKAILTDARKKLYRLLADG